MVSVSHGKGREDGSRQVQIGTGVAKVTIIASVLCGSQSWS